MTPTEWHQAYDVTEYEYTVTWSINLDAEDEVDAAWQALAIQRDRGSTAVVFFVHPIDESNNVKIIDLEEYGDPSA